MHAIYCNIWIFTVSNYDNCARKAVTFIKKFFNSLNLSTFNKICTAVQALLNHEEPTLYKLNLGASKIKKQSHEQNSRRRLDSDLIDFKTYATSVLAYFDITFNIVLTIGKNVMSSDGAKKIKLSKLYHNLKNLPHHTKINDQVRRIYKFITIEFIYILGLMIKFILIIKWNLLSKKVAFRF